MDSELGPWRENQLDCWSGSNNILAYQLFVNTNNDECFTDKVKQANVRIKSYSTTFIVDY